MHACLCCVYEQWQNTDKVHLQRVSQAVEGLCKATSKVDGDDAALQVDFSENASFVNQNEVQSAHWCPGQATVFTASVWIS